MRHLQATAEHLAGAAATPPPPASAGGAVHADTFLILLAGALCFLLCVAALAFAARCSRLCNPSSYSVDAEPEPDDGQAAAMPAAAEAAPRKGVARDALERLPTVPFGAGDGDGATQDGERERERSDECAICLAEFARGDGVRVLPPCGHAFHAACVDTWLLRTATCPSCRTALVVAPAASADPLLCCASPQASVRPAECPVSLAVVVVVERGPCRTLVP